MLDDAELAKNYVTNSNLSEDYKRIYLRLINISTMATNGITPDEKIQKMTECIQLLAVTQGLYLANIDNKIEQAISKANTKQCQNCKAMKHAETVEEELKQKKLLEDYMKKLGIKTPKADGATDDGHDETEEKAPIFWSDTIKQILVKPYIWIVLGLMMISPYSIEIVKVLCQYFAK